MDISNQYCIYTGTTRGVIASYFCKPNDKISYKIPEQKSEITALEWGRSEDEIAIGYKSGNVDFYSTVGNCYVGSLNELAGEDGVVGIGCKNNLLVVAQHGGVINIKNEDNFYCFTLNLDEKSTLECMTYHQNRENIIGVGGEHNDFKLWDVETQKCIFSAKSLGHDHLNLPIPTSVRGITFLPEHVQLSACATKEGHVLLYDERAQRKPVVKFLEKKASYTCLTSAFRERQCLAGTTRGYMQLIDLKAPGKCVKTFTNFVGSVTGISCDPCNPIVATTSLDRFLRIFDLDTKQLIQKVYMKQSLTKILMRPVIKKEDEERDHKKSDEIDEEYEELFNNMETVAENNDLKMSKRRSGSTEEISRKKRKKKKL